MSHENRDAPSLNFADLERAPSEEMSAPADAGWDSSWDPIDEPIRVTVVGEGTDDHGDLGRGPNLVEHGRTDPRGVLGELVERLIAQLCAPAILARQASGWYGSPREACQLVRWQPVDRSGRARFRGAPMATEILGDPHLTERLLENLLHPIQRVPVVPGARPADGVILVADGEYDQHIRQVEATLASNARYVERAAWVVVLPELEELLLQSRAALSSGLSLPLQAVCEPPAPSGGPTGQPKERFIAWCHSCDPTLTASSVNGALKAKVAAKLDVSAGGPLDAVAGWRELVNAAGMFVAKKKAALRRP